MFWRPLLIQSRPDGFKCLKIALKCSRSANWENLKTENNQYASTQYNNYIHTLWRGRVKNPTGIFKVIWPPLPCCGACQAVHMSLTNSLHFKFSAPSRNKETQPRSFWMSSTGISLESMSSWAWWPCRWGILTYTRGLKPSKFHFATTMAIIAWRRNNDEWMPPFGMRCSKT